MKEEKKTSICVGSLAAIVMLINDTWFQTAGRGLREKGQLSHSSTAIDWSGQIDGVADVDYEISLKHTQVIDWLNDILTDEMIKEVITSAKYSVIKRAQ